MSTVMIVDYGVGNLFSIARAIEKCGGNPVLTSSPDDVAKADRVLLPGVGAFGDGMKNLAERGLADAVRQFAVTGRPLLAICLGMQMLLEESGEFGTHAGLGILPGRVAAIPATDRDGNPHKVPHIAWAALEPAAADRWAGTPLDGTPPGAAVYFVHSYAAQPSNDGDLIANCRYGDHAIAAAIGRDNVTGCQFHPERSGPTGLAMMERFLTQ